MNVNINYNDALQSIVADVLAMDKVTEDKKGKFLKDAGNVIKKETSTILRGMKSDKNHKHMADDIKVSVKDAKTGVSGVIVGGGKQTAYKWHMLDDGTHNPNGSVHTKATHFTQKALKASEAKVEELLNNLEGAIINGN